MRPEKKNALLPSPGVNDGRMMFQLIGRIPSGLLAGSTGSTRRVKPLGTHHLVASNESIAIMSGKKFLVPGATADGSEFPFPTTWNV